MELSINECPACGAVVMGDESVCSGCGKSLLTTDATSVTKTNKNENVGAVGQQIERLRAAGYDRTETLDSETTMLNASTALHRAHLAWLRADDSEIARMGLAYLITHGVRGRRISALIVGTP